MEYGHLTFGDYFYPNAEGEVIYKNNAGDIVLHGTSPKHIEIVLTYLVDSSAETKSFIVDPKFGVEYVMWRVFTLDGEYSSTNEFTEKDFVEKQKLLKASKTIKIIAKRNAQSNADE